MFSKAEKTVSDSQAAGPAAVSDNYIELFEKWISKEIVLKNIWTCPPDNCWVWHEGDMGFCTGVYKMFCTKWHEWSQVQKCSCKAAVMGLLEVVHKLTETCYHLHQKERAGKQFTMSEENDQRVKALESQVCKLNGDSR